MKNKPLVSVNIRTFNSEKTLEKTLESVKNQTYPNTEIIVSDGNSRKAKNGRLLTDRPAIRDHTPGILLQMNVVKKTKGF